MGRKVKAKFTAYYPDSSALEGGYYDCMGVLLSTYLNSGTNVVAAPSSIAIDSKIKISGTGTNRDGGIYLVRDRGGAINIESDGTYHFDILMANATEANNWGVRYGYAELDVEGSTTGNNSSVVTKKYWVGDSRFDAIKGKATSNDIFICKSGAGYSWFVNTAVPRLKSELKNASGEVVILAMGVNDLYNKNNYISAYKSLMSSYTNVRFLVVSVNPVYEPRSEYATNSEIEGFNSALKSNFSNNYVDVYSKIKDQVNASTTDSEGVHYNDTLNQIIFDTISDAAGGSGGTSGTTSDGSSGGATGVVRPIIITKKYEYYSGQKNSNVISFTFEFQGMCVENMRVNSSYSVDTVKNEMIECSSGSRNVDKVAGKIMGLSSSSAKNLEAKSKSMWSLYSKVQYGATLEILGDPTVKVGTYCYIAVYTKYGYLHHTSGIYYIKAADDAISGGTFVTTLTLLKVGTSISNVEAYVDGLDNSGTISSDENSDTSGTVYTGDNSNLNNSQKTLVDIARSGKDKNGNTIPTEGGYCAAWVEDVYHAAGLYTDKSGFGNAIDYWNKWKSSGSSDTSNIPAGACVVGSGSGSSLGNKYGHIGIYLGDGKVADNIGHHRVVSLEEWRAFNKGTCGGKSGIHGWCWPFGKSLV